MEESVPVVDFLSNLLDSGNYQEALAVPNDEKYDASVTNNCGDMVAAILSKINDNTLTVKPSLFGACEELLSLIISKTTPEEALLECIVQLEETENDAQFSVILGLLQVLLKQLSAKRDHSLEWCFNSISTYIERIPIPEHNLEGKECKLLDSDVNVRRITKIYTLLPPFYDPFINEQFENPNTKTKQIITAFLVSLLGKPLIYIDLDPDSNFESEIRQNCNTLINDICKIEKNIFNLIILLDVCKRESHKQKHSKRDTELEYSPYKQREKINMTTLSGLSYIVFSGHFEVPDYALPQVYSIEFTVHTLLLSVVYLLKFSEYGPLSKSLVLCESILKKLSNNVSHLLLSTSVHFDLCRALINVAIYSMYESKRKFAVQLIRHHINKFNYNGRCMLVKYIIETANHSGMIGYAITLYKNSVDQSFKDPTLADCFQGNQLQNMIKKICYLPHGAESDIMELADQIITTLNFLRYLFLRDIDNKTSIRDCFSFIESNYLDKLRIGLNMSKAHYEAKLKELNEKQKINKDLDVSINVVGHILDSIPTTDKKEIIASALNAFHLIEGLLARLTESLRSGHKHVKPIITAAVHRNVHLLRNYSQDKSHTDVKSVTTVSDYDERQYEENVKNHILQKALEFVTQSGWTVESLTVGAEAAGYPGITHGLFPNGGGDLVHYFNITCNESLVNQMKSWPKEELKEGIVPTRFIENSIMTRVLMIEPYKNTWPKAMAIQTLPNNVPNCLATLLSLVDDICFHSGDRSVDFNWYLRRVGLAGIYKATELFYLTDKSNNYTATRSFVTSRIRDAQLLQSALNLNPIAAAPQTLTAAFVTAKNILGVNTLK